MAHDRVSAIPQVLSQSMTDARNDTLISNNSQPYTIYKDYSVILIGQHKVNA